MTKLLPPWGKAGKGVINRGISELPSKLWHNDCLTTVLALSVKILIKFDGINLRMEKKFRKSVSEFLIPEILDGDGDIVPIIADGEDGDLEDVDVPDSIPILSLRNTVLFPGVVLPISIGRPRSVQLIKDAYRTDKIVGTVAQKDPDLENPLFEDLHNIGTVGQIVKLLEMPDGSTTAIIQGRKRMVLNELDQRQSLFYCQGKNHSRN